ncbi:MAG: 23S rRNA (guanosine(2251)-2'-O)-methyltransferase RlmB [Bacteroidales bacterium]|nr:23S rRNA (guanosine(2251)-2'-O)-methyltransferase RlmB [Bacteroidales bacterium]
MSSESTIFGIHAVIEAVNAGTPIGKVLVRQGLSGPLALEMMGLLKHHGIPVQHVPAEVFAKFGQRNHQGVAAQVGAVPTLQLEELVGQLQAEARQPFLLLLDRITDVRNFGAIARTAECAGINGIVVPAKGAASLGPDAVKTSAGALLHVPICRVGSLKMAIGFLREQGIRIAAATEKAQQPIYTASLRGPLAIVMGAEDRGISPEVLRMADMQVQIPIMGQIGSLNVSVAAGVVIYEAIRQRKFQ